MRADDQLLDMLLNPKSYPQQGYDAGLLSLIAQLQTAINAAGVKYGGLLPNNDAFTVGLLFNDKPVTTTNVIRDHNRASMSVMIEFLDWVTDLIKKGQVPNVLLTNFLFDLGNVGFLQTNGRTRGRALTWVGNFNYSDLCGWYCLGNSPGRVYSETLSIFGIRQTLESKFKELVGFGGLVPIVKIPHDFFPAIIRKVVNSGKLKFSSSVDIGRVMRVYSWTNRSVHEMESDLSWKVWKAFQVCAPLFAPIQAGGTMSLSASATICNRDFADLRKKVEVEVARKLIDRGLVSTLTWKKPEALITDTQGNLDASFNGSSRVQIRGRHAKGLLSCLLALVFGRLLRRSYF